MNRTLMARSSNESEYSVPQQSSYGQTLGATRITAIPSIIATPTHLYRGFGGSCRVSPAMVLAVVNPLGFRGEISLASQPLVNKPPAYKG